MADHEVQFFYADAKPTADIVAHALYFIKPVNAAEAQIFKGNAAGDGLVPFSEKLSGQNALIVFSADEPNIELHSDYHRFWFNTTSGLLMANQTDYQAEYASGNWVDNAVWVPSVTLPEGLKLGTAGGTAGVADTAARYDHYHTGVVVEGAEF